MSTMALLSQQPSRSYQLIKRDFDITSPTYGEDLMVLDILGPGSMEQGVGMLENFAGLYHAPRTPIRQSWAYQEGSTPSDFPRVEERLIDIRLVTRGVTTEEWEQVDAMLWEILTFTQEAILRVTSNVSAPREIRVRLDRKPKDNMKFDPGVMRHMVWEVTLVACDPYWYSSTLTSSWTNNSGTGNGTLVLQNDADVECWVQFASNEIMSSQTWTLPDGIYPANKVTLPTLSVGQSFLVDTYPLAETLMVLDDSQMWAAMNSKAFLYSIPPKTPPTVVPVKVVGGGYTATITAYMTQRWDRPWSVAAPWRNDLVGLNVAGN